MTLNPRHPGISIFTGFPVRPQSEGVPFYGRRTAHRRDLSTHTTHKCDTSRRFGEAYPAYLAYPAVLSADQWPGFDPVGGT